MRSRTSIGQLHEMPFGPVTVTRDETGLWVHPSTERDVFVAMPYNHLQPHGANALRDGVDVAVAGDVVARAHQADRGLLRRDRVVHLDGLVPGVVPAGTHLRYRRLTTIALQTDDRILVRSVPNWFSYSVPRLFLADGVSDDLAVIYVAMSFAFRFAI